MGAASFPLWMFGESAARRDAGPGWGSAAEDGGVAEVLSIEVGGAPPALHAAVREHDAMLRGLARRLCGNAADADDLVHDAYERAMRAWGRVVDRSNLRGWLSAILHNLFIDRCRKGQRTPRSEGSEQLDRLQLAAVEQVAPPIWAQLSGDSVTGALVALGPELRGAYELRAQGRSYEEIAAALGIPRATVGTRLVRARQRLKEILLRELGEAR